MSSVVKSLWTILGSFQNAIVLLCLKTFDDAILNIIFFGVRMVPSEAAFHAEFDFDCPEAQGFEKQRIFYEFQKKGAWWFLSWL